MPIPTIFISFSVGKGEKKKDQPKMPIARTDKQGYELKVDVATQAPTLTQKPVGSSLPAKQDN